MGTFTTQRWLRRMILFDANCAIGPWLSDQPRYLIGRLACTKLSDEAKRQVLGESMVTLLQRRGIPI